MFAASTIYFILSGLWLLSYYLDSTPDHTRPLLYLLVADYCLRQGRSYWNEEN